MIQITLRLEVDEKGIKLTSHGKPNKKFNKWENELTIGLMKVVKAFLQQATTQFSQAVQTAQTAEDIIKNGKPTTEAASGQPSPESGIKNNLIQLPHSGTILSPTGHKITSPKVG